MNGVVDEAFRKHYGRAWRDTAMRWSAARREFSVKVLFVDGRSTACASSDPASG
ncbi:MAG: hypothetical protein ABR583_10910 [Gaiellaceae bacterium]